MSKLFNKQLFRKAVLQAGMFSLLTGGLAWSQAGEPPKYLGAPSCASSSCHGGGGVNQNQYFVWSLKDFHSQRPVATLGTARSKQIADALNISNPATDARCASCHAPLADVPETRRGAGFSVAEGVSCESCHGPAENWLRSHTRTDWTRADRVFAGLRDLQSLYVRANTCVACHQNVSTDLLKAGHPELIFELDGQCVAEPKHWREKAAWNRAQSWLVGQAVALREMSWELSTEQPANARQVARWRGLLWVLQKLDGLNPELPALGKITNEITPENLLAAKTTADALARSAANQTWTDRLARAALMRLAGTAADFSKTNEGDDVPARRAERLVLALDRLLLTQASWSTNAATGQSLNQLFKLAQSVPDFDPVQFGNTLNQFAAGLKSAP